MRFFIAPRPVPVGAVEALDALEEAHRGDGGRPITFSSFKELLGKAAEEATRQRAGREQP